MTAQPYPSTLAEIDSWSQDSGVPTLEARIRFMEFVILNCVASHVCYSISIFQFQALPRAVKYNCPTVRPDPNLKVFPQTYQGPSR